MFLCLEIKFNGKVSSDGLPWSATKDQVNVKIFPSPKGVGRGFTPTTGCDLSTNLTAPFPHETRGYCAPNRRVAFLGVIPVFAAREEKASGCS